MCKLQFHGMCVDGRPSIVHPDGEVFFESVDHVVDINRFAIGATGIVKVARAAYRAVGYVEIARIIDGTAGVVMLS